MKQNDQISDILNDIIYLAASSYGIPASKVLRDIAEFAQASTLLSFRYV